MKITRKLTLLALLPLLLLFTIAIAAISTYDTLDDTRETARLAAELETRVFALGILTYDYLSHREERARRQWQQVQGELERALAQAHPPALALPALDRLRDDRQALAAAFAQLVEHISTRQASPGRLWFERESSLSTRILVNTQRTFTDAVTLHNRAEQSAANEQNLFFSTTLLLLTIAAATAAVLAWRTVSGIRSSLQRLNNATAIMARGNLDYRTDVPTHDEHSELAQAFNAMAHNLKAIQQQMIQSEKLSALGTLAGGVAHELNNPLMGVMGYVGLARSRVDDPELRETLNRAHRELERMRDLLKNMLGFVQPVDEELSTVDVVAVIQRALALMQPEFRSADIEVSTDFPADFPRVSAKKEHLEQVFLNLLRNARDALAQSPEKRVRIAARVRGNNASVEVADSGAGIPEAIKDRIFDPFVTTKSPGRGTGLGLSICRKIVTDLGGTLRGENRKGGGAVFTVELPLESWKSD